jgi:hypothetical protein
MESALGPMAAVVAEHSHLQGHRTDSTQPEAAACDLTLCLEPPDARPSVALNVTSASSNLCQQSLLSAIFVGNGAIQ